MVNIVLAGHDKIDYETTFEKVTILESVGELKESSTEESETFVLPATEQNATDILNESHTIFMPSTLLKQNHLNADGVHIYFDLENYPFFKKISEVVKNEEKKKGVFRFRRTVSHEEDTLQIASDLYVLVTLFGKPESVVIKHSDRAKNPYHIILMVNFSGGTMSHLEYTFSDNESIEIDWSGIKRIIEFNSKEMSPIKPNTHTALPLTCNLDSIMTSAHRVDPKLIEQLNKFRDVVEGGIRQ